MAISAGIAAVGAVAGGMIQSQGAQSAASTEANAATQNENNVLATGQQASQMDLGAISGANAPLQPYVTLGNTATGTLSNLLTGANNGQMQQALQSMPGYQFQLQQGLESTQNGFAARGLGSSGAAMKGAANYAEGLASSNYQNFWNNALSAANMGAGAAATQSQNIGNLTMAGANALTGAAGQGAQLGMAGAAASAAGQIGAANALGSSISTAGNLFGQYNMLTGMMNPSYGTLGGAGATSMYGSNPLAGANWAILP